MHNKRNVIVMFLLIMLSFAIISEVSANDDAEINGTGSNHPVMSVDMPKNDIASERDNGNMQNHIDDCRSHNEQKSFDKTPRDLGDNKSNEILYENNMDLKPNHDLNETGDFNLFKPDQKPLDFNKSMENMSDFKNKPMFDLKNFTNDFNNPALRDNNFTNVPDDRGELMDDVVSKLMGLNSIAPNFKKDDKNISSKNQKPMGKDNESAPLIPDGKDSSDIGSDNINKNTKTLKIDKKSKNNTKHVKKSTKKVKSTKKSKKVNKKLPKKFNKERAKL